MATDRTDPLIERLALEIDSSGPMPFSRFMNRALYEPDLGFYERGGSAGGRRGDFITSVETGPLFAAMVGEWLDRTWHELGRPAPFVVAEAAAGVGTLWRGLRRAEPECFEDLHWVLVERSAHLRAQHRGLPDGGWESRADLPTDPVHAVVANELLDNLAFDVAEWTGDRWREARVDRVDERFVWVLGGVVPIDLPAEGSPTGGSTSGARIPVAVDALDWLERARHIAERVLVFDYGATTAELVERGNEGWLRTYAEHGRVGSPLDHPGRADITHDVPFDQLPPPRRHHRQAEWLRAHGLDRRVEAARTTWSERAAVGDLAALFARSAITEAQALTDPAGLGGFAVLEW